MGVAAEDPLHRVAVVGVCLTLLLAALAAGVGAFGTRTIAADGNVSAALAPGNAEMTTEGTVTLDVVVSDIGGNVGAAETVVRLAGNEPAELTGMSAAGSPRYVTENPVGNEGTSARLEAAYGDSPLTDADGDGAITIATVTVGGVQPGNTAVDLTVESLGDGSGESYTVTSSQGADLVVVEPTPTPTPTSTPTPEPEPVSSNDDDDGFSDGGADSDPEPTASPTPTPTPTPTATLTATPTPSPTATARPVPSNAREVRRVPMTDVDPNRAGMQIRVDGTDVREVSVLGNASGTLTVATLAGVPDGLPEPAGEPIRVVAVELPDSVADEPGQLSLSPPPGPPSGMPRS